MTPNPQQQAVIDFALRGTGSCNVIARAGCGKTSLIVAMVKAILDWNRRLRVFVGAFNKSIAIEVEQKIITVLAGRGYATVGTMHKAGLQMFKTIRPAFEIDGKKVYTLARKRHAYDKKSIRVVTDAVGFAKQMGLGLPIDGLRSYEAVAMWRQILEEYELAEEIPDEVSDERIIESCIQVYRQSIEMCHDTHAKIDFNDMLLMPLMMASNEDQFRQYDWVMIDELQDQNSVRRLLAERILRKGGRFCGVGDPAQAIYAFAGADSDSMALTAKFMQCQEFPLNVTYRCPTSIVILAQEWVPDFTAAEGNIEGKITTITHDALWKQDFDPDNDVILCRTRRPLVGIAKRLRARGIQCVVEGGNGRGLIALAEKWGEVSVGELKTLLKEYKKTEAAKFRAKDKDEKAEAVEDRVDILLDVMYGLDEELDTVDEVTKRIERMFDDSGESKALKLCTVHRSKGREWRRVFLIGRSVYMPSYWAQKSADKGKPEALKQENNLQYVAVTRSKEMLVEVDVPSRKKKSYDDPDWWEE